MNLSSGMSADKSADASADALSIIIPLLILPETDCSSGLIVCCNEVLHTRVLKHHYLSGNFKHKHLQIHCYEYLKHSSGLHLSSYNVQYGDSDES